MNVSIKEIEEVVVTLPISYYAKRRVPIFPEHHTKVGTSYYDPAKDEIHIDCGLIQSGLKNAPEVEDEKFRETAIRSMVYHELSHAILTPSGSKLQDELWWSNLPPAIFNIFEDERIETILKDFYINVNFKKNLLYIHGNSIPTPTNPEEKFFNLVRFRCYQGTKWAERVNKIIEDYRDVNVNSLNNGDYKEYKLAERYIVEVAALYHDFIKEESKGKGVSDNPSERTDIENSINGTGTSEGFSDNNVEEKTGEGNGKDEEGEECEGQGEGQGKRQSEGQDKRTEGNNTSDSLEGQGKGGRGGGGARNALFNKVFNKEYSRYHDNALTAELDVIISNFNKKNSSGSGCTSYSGVFNPRNVAREDYRYFDKKTSARGNNTYGTFHLNLVIDNSGSFSLLQDSANTLINSLVDIERKNSNFTFDVIFSNVGLLESTKDNRYVVASGGNELEYDEVLSVMNKHKKKNAYVYNIVMHDGWTNAESRGSKNAFLAWNTSNTTIIDTGDNECYLNDLKSAKVVITPYDDLVKTLGHQVASILRTAFR